MNNLLKTDFLFTKISEISLLDSKHFINVVEKILDIKYKELKNNAEDVKNNEKKETTTINKTSYEIFLIDVTESSTKMKTITLVRDILKIELKAAKVIVEKAPTSIKLGLSLEEAENIKKKFENIGVKTEIK